MSNIDSSGGEHEDELNSKIASEIANELYWKVKEYLVTDGDYFCQFSQRDGNILVDHTFYTFFFCHICKKQSLYLKLHGQN